MVPKKVSENYSFLNIVLLQLGHWQLYLLSLDPLLSSIPKNSSNIQSGTPYSIRTIHISFQSVLHPLLTPQALLPYTPLSGGFFLFLRYFDLCLGCLYIRSFLCLDFSLRYLRSLNTQARTLRATTKKPSRRVRSLRKNHLSSLGIVKTMWRCLDSKAIAETKAARRWEALEPLGAESGRAGMSDDSLLATVGTLIKIITQIDRRA